MLTLLLLSNNKTRNYRILIVHDILSMLSRHGSQLIYDARTLAVRPRACHRNYCEDKLYHRSRFFLNLPLQKLSKQSFCNDVFQI